MFFFRRNPKKRSLPENLGILQQSDDPAWVWDTDYAIIVWANGRGLKFWDVETVAELRELFFAETHPLTIAGAKAATKLGDVSETREYLFLNPFAATVGYKFTIQSQVLPDGRNGLLMVGDLKDFRAESEIESEGDGVPFNLENEPSANLPFRDETVYRESDADLERLSGDQDGPKNVLNERFGAGASPETAIPLKSVKKSDATNFNPPFSFHPSEKNTKSYAEIHRKRIQSGAVFNGDKYSSEPKEYVNGPTVATDAKQVAPEEKNFDRDENAPFPVLELDPNGKILYANQNAQKTFMLKVGNNFSGLFEDVVKGRLTCAALFANDRMNETYELLCKGEKSEYQAGAFKLNDQIVRIFLVAAQTKTSASASENPASLSGVISAVGAALFTLSASGEILTVSAAAKKLTGLFPEEMIGKSFTALFSADEHDRIHTMFTSPDQFPEVFEEGTSVRFLGNGGAVCDGNLLLREQQDGFWAALYDESLMEEMRREIDVLKEKIQTPAIIASGEGAVNEAFTGSSAIPPIVSAVSHEVRAPLNAVTGYAEMIESEIFGSLGDPRYKEFAKQIGVAGRYMSEIIGDLLDLSKVNSGEFKPDFKPTDLNRLVDEAVASLYPVALKKDVDIQGTVLSGTPLIHADPRLLKQAMINLLSNAVNYSPDGEQVYIAAGPTKTGRVMIEITDFGGGMTKEELEKAMRPFARGNESDGKGTGLGLPLAKRLTEIQGARFSIDSVPGEKTRARIVFPESSLLHEEPEKEARENIGIPG